MTFLDGLTFGAGQAIGQAFTFFALAGVVVLAFRWAFKRIVG